MGCPASASVAEGGGGAVADALAKAVRRAREPRHNRPKAIVPRLRKHPRAAEAAAVLKVGLRAGLLREVSRKDHVQAIRHREQGGVVSGPVGRGTNRVHPAQVVLLPVNQHRLQRPSLGLCTGPSSESFRLVS